MTTRVSRRLTVPHGVLPAIREVSWPIPLVSTIVFFALMVAYPLMLGFRNYGIGQGAGSVMLSNAQLQLDLSWMHVTSDVVAGMYGAWIAYRVCSARSMICPPWKGVPTSRYAIPMVKAGLVCACSYVIACGPAIYMTMRSVGGPFPWYPLLSGMVVLFAMCCFGFAVAVITGSRWSLLLVGLILFLLCVAGMYAIRWPTPEGVTFPRTWGDPLSLVLPISDTGIGAEPGLHMTTWGVVVRAGFYLIIAVGALAACGVFSRSWMKNHKAHVVKAVCVLALVPIVAGGLVAWVGPGMWARAEPFTPVCDNVEQSGVVVCSHPDDTAKQHRYVSYVRAALAWMPQAGTHDDRGRHHDLYFLLGNSFTAASSSERWNLSDQGKTMIPHANATVIELMTDTITMKNSVYSDPADMMRAIVENKLPAPCAASAAQTVFEQDALHGGADISAFILEQLPTAMRATAYGSMPVGLSSQYYVDGSSDKTIKILGTADDQALQDFIHRHATEIGTCSLTPETVANDPIAQDLQ